MTDDNGMEMLGGGVLFLATLALSFLGYLAWWIWA